MKWKVENAVNRDVERQHLNKILAEIESAVGGGAILTEADVRKIVAESATSTTPAPRPISIRLHGDVTGSGSGTTGVDIEVEFLNTQGYIEDAPTDGNSYWRVNGSWGSVPESVVALDSLTDTGMVAYDADLGVFNSRVIEGTSGNIVVTNGDGVIGNPSVDLEEVPDGGTASTLVKITRDSYGRVDNTQAATATDVPVAVLGVASHSNVQEVINVLNSPGLVDGGGFTDNGGGVLGYSSMRIAIRPTDSDVATLYMADVSAGTVLIPNDSATRFVGVQYNGGTPSVVTKTADTWDYDTEFPLGEVANLGGTLFPLFNPYKVGDPTTNIIQRLDAQAYAVRSADGGMELSTVGITRNLAMTAGTLWTRLNDHPVVARNSSTVPLYRVTPTGGTPPLSFTPGVTQWPNTQFVSGTTLTTMTNNHWAVLWVFVNVGTGAWGFAHGTAEYNQAAGASVEQVPAYLTANFLRQNILVGRLIFQKSADTAIIESAFTRVFSTQAVSNHNQLSGLQGGSLNDYQHLTAAQLASVNTSVQSVTAGAGVIVNNTDPRNPVVSTPVKRGYIEGLLMEWVAGNSITVSAGCAYIPSSGSILELPSAVTKTGFPTTQSAWHHVYLFSNAGTPDVEIVTTAPATPYYGQARTKTGDTTRRYIGSVLTDSGGAVFKFAQNDNQIDYYENPVPPFRVLSGGTAQVRTSVSLSQVVPVTSEYVVVNTINNSDLQVFIDIPEIGNSGLVTRYTCLANQRTPVMAVVKSRTLTYQYAATPTGSGAFIDVWGYKYGR